MKFFQALGVIDREGQPTQQFGDPLWVFQQYLKRKGDLRPIDEILAQGRAEIAAVRSRGLFISEGFGSRPRELPLTLEQEVRHIYEDAKQSIWAELPEEFIATIPGTVRLHTRSHDRSDYILHPVSGEQLSVASQQAITEIRETHAGQYDVQIIVSDGLNALSISDEDQLLPYLDQVRKNLAKAGLKVAPENLVIQSGRVRAGYRIGETLFGGWPGTRTILHVIGERPGSGHHTFSVYMTPVTGEVWGTAGQVDHNLTRVVAGISTTTLTPIIAADESVRILMQMIDRG